MIPLTAAPSGLETYFSTSFAQSCAMIFLRNDPTETLMAIRPVRSPSSPKTISHPATGHRSYQRERRQFLIREQARWLRAWAAEAFIDTVVRSTPDRVIKLRLRRCSNRESVGLRRC